MYTERSKRNRHPKRPGVSTQLMLAACQGARVDLLTNLILFPLAEKSKIGSKRHLAPVDILVKYRGFNVVPLFIMLTSSVQRFHSTIVNKLLINSEIYSPKLMTTFSFSMALTLLHRQLLGSP